MSIRLKIATAWFFLAIFIPSAPATEIWYEDNNLGKAGGMPSDFVEKFRKPETFMRASRYIDVYMMRANVLSRLDDKFLFDVFLPYLLDHRMKLAIDTGAATYIQIKNRSRVFDRSIALLERLKALGASVDYISLQSALSKSPKVDGQKVEYPLHKRVDDIVEFSKAAIAIYPKVEIGLIDALLSHGKDYRKPYRLIFDALARNGVRLSYIHLDIPFDAARRGRRGSTWQSIKALETFVEEDLGLEFGLYATSRRSGQTSSKAFHESVIAALECYTGAGGTPDEFIIASWFRYPDKTVPEDATGDDYPAMRTVLEFGQRLDRIEVKSKTSKISDRSTDPGWQFLCTA